MRKWGGMHGYGLIGFVPVHVSAWNFRFSRTINVDGCHIAGSSSFRYVDPRVSGQSQATYRESVKPLSHVAGATGSTILRAIRIHKPSHGALQVQGWRGRWANVVVLHRWVENTGGHGVAQAVLQTVKPHAEQCWSNERQYQPVPTSPLINIVNAFADKQDEYHR
jgi:hypothetical protein